MEANRREVVFLQFVGKKKRQRVFLQRRPRVLSLNRSLYGCIASGTGFSSGTLRPNFFVFWLAGASTGGGAFLPTTASVPCCVAMPEKRVSFVRLICRVSALGVLV